MGNTVITFEAAANAYLSEKRKTRRESTVEGYESSLRLHVIPRWGGGLP